MVNIRDLIDDAKCFQTVRQMLPAKRMSTKSVEIDEN